MQSPVYESLRD